MGNTNISPNLTTHKVLHTQNKKESGKELWGHYQERSCKILFDTFHDFPSFKLNSFFLFKKLCINVCYTYIICNVFFHLNPSKGVVKTFATYVGWKSVFLRLCFEIGCIIQGMIST